MIPPLPVLRQRIVHIQDYFVVCGQLETLLLDPQDRLTLQDTEANLQALQLGYERLFSLQVDHAVQEEQDREFLQRSTELLTQQTNIPLELIEFFRDRYLASCRTNHPLASSLLQHIHLQEHEEARRFDRCKARLLAVKPAFEAKFPTLTLTDAFIEEVVQEPEKLSFRILDYLQRKYSP